MKPIVAIVGRPNVGKSTLFNRVSRERRSLVNDLPGVTRDRIYVEVIWNDRSFILIDTGGFEPAADEPLRVQVREQAELAIHEADAILFLLDAQDGLTPSDRDAAEALRRTSKPLHYVVNKVDGPRHDSLGLEFYELGAERLHMVSAKYGRGVSDLLDALTQDFSPGNAQQPAHEASGIRVAVVGRPNVGKSSLMNRLCGQERSVVSPTPGTTHDSVDTAVRWHGKRFVLVDTAGIRRKSRTRLPLEKYCVIKALTSIERCDVALLLVEAAEGITDQDARIGGYIVERGRGCVIVVNKWDLLAKDNHTFDQYVKRVKEGLPHLDFAPVLTASALTGLRVGRLLALVEQVYGSCGQRIPTSSLNQRFHAWVAANPPPRRRRKPVRLYYITQPSVYPPTFVAFTNDLAGVSVPYSRYLMNRIREEFGFTGAPVRLHFRQKARV